MKPVFLFLFLLPTLLFAQKSVPIKVRSSFDSTVLNPLKKAYYAIGYGVDSTQVTIKSIDGTQVDTIKFSGGSGFIQSTAPYLDIYIHGPANGEFQIPAAGIGISYTTSNSNQSPHITALDQINYNEDGLGNYIDTIIFNNLYSTGFYLNINLSSLTNNQYVRFPKLKYVNYGGGWGGSAKTLLFDSLLNTQRFYGTIYDTVFNGFPVATSGGITMGSASLTTITLPSFISDGGNGLTLTSCTALKRLIMPRYAGGNLSCDGVGTLNYVLISSSISPAYYTSLIFRGCALDQGSVDRILLAAVSGGATSGQIDITGGTNSPPSASGLTAKATLISLGWNVNTN